MITAHQPGYLRMHEYNLNENLKRVLFPAENIVAHELRQSVLYFLRRLGKD